MKPVKTVLNHIIDWFPTILELANTKDGDSNKISFNLIFEYKLTHPYKNTPADIDGVSLVQTIHNPQMKDKDQQIRDRLIIGVFHHFQKPGSTQYRS